MKIQAMHIGMKVRHPQYGEGMVRALNEHTAEIRFDDGNRTIAPENSGVEPAEAQAALTGLNRPLRQFIAEVVESTVESLGVEKPDSSVSALAARWHGGRLVMHPADPTLQTKEVPIEVFFHKIVMMRNNLRVLEQKVNGHERLSDAEKVEMQQYVTRCYGSMTTFNILFRTKEEQFGG